MTRVSTEQIYQSALLGVFQAQDRQAIAGRQLATGYKANDLKGFADQGATLPAAKSVSARTQALLDNNAVLTERLLAQDQALGNVASAAAGAGKSVTEAIAVGDGTTLMHELQGWFSQASQGLNADYAGSHLFAGGTTDQLPVDTTDLAALQAPATTAQHLHDGLLSRTDRIDESTAVKTSFTATEVGKPLMDALKAIVDYDQPPTGPLTGKLTDAQIDFLKSQLAPLTAAGNTVRGFQTHNGVLQAQVETTTDLLNGRKSAVDGLIAKRTEADPAETATRLQLAGVALQASAQVFASLSGSSLLRVLQG